jgi:hypothetical protein
MRSRYRPRLRSIRVVCAVFVLNTVLCIVSCQWSKQLQTALYPDDGFDERASVEMRLSHDKSMMALAHDLDHLEKHIDWYGSVVPKIPDVWGQARLTQHREEFEDQMKLDLSGFTERLNGRATRDDQSYAAQATALSIAASGPVAVQTIPRGTVGSDEKINSTTKSSTSEVKQVITPTTDKSPLPSDLTNEKVSFGTDRPVGFPSVYHQSLKATTEDKKTALGIALEPTLVLAQKARYLDYLNQIRRTNEGDDTADSAGYSLNLVRVPVSVLPGKKTDEGWGAEITFTINPILGDELLPMTFRNMVINDLVDFLGFPLAKFLDNPENHDLLTPENRNSIFSHCLQFTLGSDQSTVLARVLANPNLSLDTRVALANRLEKLETTTKKDLGEPRISEKTAIDVVKDYDAKYPGVYTSFPVCFKNESELLAFEAEIRGIVDRIVDPGNRLKAQDALNAQRAQMRQKNDYVSRRLKATIAIPSIPFSNQATDKTPFPRSQIIDVYGAKFAFEVAFKAFNSMKDDIARQKYAHLPDLQAFLKEEANGAYRFLSLFESYPLWRFCDQKLVKLIRNRDADSLCCLREAFRCQFLCILNEHRQKCNAPGCKDLADIPEEYSLTAALSWFIIVDAALLSDRLTQDMKEAAASKGLSLPATLALDFYHPQPSQEAKQAFAAYVSCRWPIRVFALDPMAQDQNIADALSTRRETQLALSMAFTTGRMGARSFSRWARRLDSQFETIALNRTQIGFSHGENTFGWRFYPRFQTPDTPSNAEALFRDQLIGGPSRNQLLRERRLEPGPRECVAVVMMPAFLPYVSVESTSNWFNLANPKHKALDHSAAMKLSRTVKTLQMNGPCIKDSERYRSQDLQIMTGRIGQLENRLPTQTMQVQIPTINTLGGFEMFNNGVTDLAPELYGFYGAPGIMTGANKETTLFLVGDHFSPLRTRVIVGNTTIDNQIQKPNDAPTYKQRMLSRQVMQISVTGANAVDLDGFFHIHVATPYGVSRELRVPAIPPSAAVTKTPEYQLSKNKLIIQYEIQQQGQKLRIQNGVPKAGSNIVIATDDPAANVISYLDLEFTFTINSIPGIRFNVKNVSRIKGEFAIEVDQLNAFAQEIITKLDATGNYPIGIDPLAAGLKSTSVTITPFFVDSTKDKLTHRAGKSAKSVNPLEIEFNARELKPQKSEEKKPPKEDKGERGLNLPQTQRDPFRRTQPDPGVFRTATPK